VAVISLFLVGFVFLRRKKASRPAIEEQSPPYEFTQLKYEIQAEPTSESRIPPVELHTGEQYEAAELPVHENTYRLQNAKN